MNYVVSDIHNNNDKFSELIKYLNLREEDKLYILGDLFDRSNYNPDPVGVYFNVLKLGERCQIIRGNHEQTLADYIITYYQTKERKRKKLESYAYNSFELMLKRLTLVDMYHLAKRILEWPLQIELEIEGKKYLLAHAMTGNPKVEYADEYFLSGEGNPKQFLEFGIDGYISICGHLKIGGSSIWRNTRENVIICDCGCGFGSGRLGCLCLETGEEIYV